MSKAKEVLKAQLLAQAEAAIDALLSQPEVHPQMNLSRMEAVVGEMGEQFEQGVLQELINRSQGAGQGLCPSCGGHLAGQGKRAKKLITVRGEIRVERDYYLCTECGQGYFPPG